MKPQFSSVPQRLYKAMGKLSSGEQRLYTWGPELVNEMLGWRPWIKKSVAFELPPPDAEGDKKSGWRELVITQKIKGVFLPFDNVCLVTKYSDLAFVVLARRVIAPTPTFSIATNHGEYVVKDDEEFIEFRWFLEREDGFWLPCPMSFAVINSLQDGERTTHMDLLPTGVGGVNAKELFAKYSSELSSMTNVCSASALRLILNLCTALDVGRKHTKTTVIKSKSTTVRTPKNENKKRAFYEIHRVVINPTIVDSTYEPKGGTHASPRWHKRRGYWRTMKKSGKVVWVQACEVGKKSDGMVYKDYEVVI